MTDRMALRAQRRCQLAGALGRPAQRQLWIAARQRIDQRFQRGDQRRVLLGQRFAARPRPPDPTRSRRQPSGLGLLQVTLARMKGAARHARSARDKGHATVAQGRRFRGRPHPAGPLVQERAQCDELLPYRLDERWVIHSLMESHSWLPRILYSLTVP